LAEGARASSQDTPVAEGEGYEGFRGWVGHFRAGGDVVVIVVW
jgi:hypothetical protein